MVATQSVAPSPPVACNNIDDYTSLAPIVRIAYNLATNRGSTCAAHSYWEVLTKIWEKRSAGPKHDIESDQLIGPQGTLSGANHIGA
jgi:hypothetical protein